MGKLIGLLFLVLVIAVIANDYARTRDQKAAADAAKKAAAADPMSGLPISRGQNDPALAALQQQTEINARLVGAVLGGAAGAGVGRAAGTAVSSAEVETARGLGSNPVTPKEVNDLNRNSFAAGAAAGQAAGSNAGGVVGGATGSFIASTPFAFIGGIGSSAAGAGSFVAEQLAAATPSRQLYDVPGLGGIFRKSDELFGGRP